MIEEVNRREARVPPLWDGAASGRIVDVLAAELPLDTALSTRRLG